MAQLFERFNQHCQSAPNKMAFIDGSLQLSYGQLADKIDQVIQWLQPLAQQQAPNGLRVLSVCHEPFHHVCLSLALSKLNGTLIPTNAQSTTKQVARFCQAVEADCLVYDLAEIDFSQTDLSENQPLNLLPQLAIQSAFNADKNDQAWSKSVDVTPHDSFLLTLSSGSTGKPKPIVISQAVKLARAQQTIDLYGITSEDVVLNASPFFHSLGQRLTFVPLMAGATVVFLNKFTPQAWLDAVEANQVSFTIPVATHLYALQLFIQSSFDRVRSLKTLVTSSAPIDAEFKKALQQEIQCDLHEIYGATEIAIATNLCPADFAQKHHTVGLPCKGIEIRIVNDCGDQQTAEDLGEIVVKTPLLFSGYYRLPELTEQAFLDGFFRTGDLGYIDADGYLVYVSRQKDVIISGGINIYPAEIEQCLLSSKEIQAVSVIGANDALLGEVVLAICVGEASAERALRQKSNQELASYQRPMRYFFVEQLPLTASGKIDKMALRETYNALDEDWSAPLRALMYRQ